MRRSIDLTTKVRATAFDAATTLRSRPGVVLAGQPEQPGGRVDAFRTTLHVDGRNGSVRYDVMVRIEEGESADTWHVALEPGGRGRLLPSFAGELSVADTFGGGADVHLSGSYEPPLGRVGAFGDGLVGHHLARQSLDAFLQEVARRIDDEVDARVPAGGRPALAPLDLRDRASGPEIWVG